MAVPAVDEEGGAAGRPGDAGRAAQQVAPPVQYWKQGRIFHETALIMTKYSYNRAKMNNIENRSPVMQAEQPSR